MEGNGRWSLFGAAVFLVVGVNMLVRGVGPDWYSFVSVVLVFIAAAVWLGRYVVDRRKAKVTPPTVDEA
jgi:drug/metabolite transporter (DMT)-like permease